MKIDHVHANGQSDVQNDGSKVEYPGDEFSKQRALEEIRLAELKLKEWSSIYESLTRKKDSSLPRISDISVAQILNSEDPVRLAFLSLQQDDVSIPGQDGSGNSVPLL